MRVAIFSDVHGRLRIMLRMVQCWQIQHRTHLDGVLLAGDIGCFPDESRFDKATRRWIERDPEEAGFPRYFMRPKAEIEEVFRGVHEGGEFAVVHCPILFVAGNHEDFAYLQECRKSGPAPGMPPHTFPVDCYRRVHCIDNGHIALLRGADGCQLKVAGLWGVENSPAGSPKAISKDAASTLARSWKGSFDVLLTHDAPGHSYTGHAASSTISEVLRACEPPLHVFGHAHPVDGRHEFFADPIPTRSWILEDVCFGKKCEGSLRNAMGILHCDARQGAPACRVEIADDPWLAKMRHQSWMHVWPEPDGVS